MGVYRGRFAYRSLDHVIPTIAHVTDKVENINRALNINPLQHVVNGDECASSTNTSTGGGDQGCGTWNSVHVPAMDDHGTTFLRMVLEDSLPEGEEVRGVERHPMIWPHQEVKLPHLTHGHGHTTLASKLQGGEG